MIKKTEKKETEKAYRFRLAVFRSARYIYAQVIDDRVGRTIVTASEKDIKSTPQGEKSTKIVRAGMVGKILAEAALKKNIRKVHFDRRQFKYHGRVRALAEGARKGGLSF